MQISIDMFAFSPRRVDEIISQSKNYLKTYVALIKLARCNGLDAETRQTALALAVYGWMPTIPKRFESRIYIETVADILDHDHALAFVRNLPKPIINNSWVGTSKIFHFINPEHFPIWDSKVAKRLGVTAMTKQSRYIDYITAMHQTDEVYPDAGAPLATAINEKFGYRPTNLRCFELELFTPLR